MRPYYLLCDVLIGILVAWAAVMWAEAPRNRGISLTHLMSSGAGLVERAHAGMGGGERYVALVAAILSGVALALWWLLREGPLPRPWRETVPEPLEGKELKLPASKRGMVPMPVRRCEDPGEMYVDLLHRSVTMTLEEDLPMCSFDVSTSFLVPGGSFDRQTRYEGQDIPSTALTSCGLRHLLLLHRALETVVHECVAGDVLLAGLERGGVPLAIQGSLRILADLDDRRVLLWDEFIAPSKERSGAPSASVRSWLARRFVRGCARSLRGFLLSAFLHHAQHHLPWTLRESLAAEDWRPTSPSARRAVAWLRALDHSEVPAVSSEPRCSMDALRDTMRRFGLEGYNVVLDSAAWGDADARDRLDECGVKRLALVRVELPRYSWTRSVLKAAYGRLSPGGFVVIAPPLPPGDTEETFGPSFVGVGKRLQSELDPGATWFEWGSWSATTPRAVGWRKPSVGM